MRKALKSINVNHFLAIVFVLLIVEKFNRMGAGNLNLGFRGLLFGLLAGLYAIRYVWKKENYLKSTLKLIVVNLWCFFYIFSLDRPPFFEAIRFLFVLFGSAWLTYEIMERVLRIKLFHSNTILFTGALILSLEALCRVMRWPWGSMLQLVAYLILVAGFLLEGRRWGRIESSL